MLVFPAGVLASVRSGAPHPLAFPSCRSVLPSGGGYAGCHRNAEGSSDVGAQRVERETCPRVTFELYSLLQCFGLFSVSLRVILFGHRVFAARWKRVRRSPTQSDGDTNKKRRHRGGWALRDSLVDERRRSPPPARFFSPWKQIIRFRLRGET